MDLKRRKMLYRAVKLVMYFFAMGQVSGYLLTFSSLLMPDNRVGLFWCLIVVGVIIVLSSTVLFHVTKQYLKKELRLIRRSNRCTIDNKSYNRF
jgi:hypothetical protein